MTAGGATGVESMEVFTMQFVSVPTGFANPIHLRPLMISCAIFVTAMDGEETAAVGAISAVLLRP